VLTCCIMHMDAHAIYIHMYMHMLGLEVRDGS